MRCILDDLVAAGQITQAEADATRARRKAPVASPPVVGDKAVKRASAVAAWHSFAALCACLEQPTLDG